MPVREIDETEFQNKQALANLVATMQANPKSREHLEKALKIVKPDASTPITDAKAEVLEELQKEREARLELEKKFNEDIEARSNAEKTQKFANEWERQKTRLRTPAGGGYTDEGIEAIEKLAEERGIPDLEAAAALFAKLNPPKETPIQPNGVGGFALFEPKARDSEDFKKLFDSQGEDNTVLQTLINEALSDVRSGR